MCQVAGKPGPLCDQCFARLLKWDWSDVFKPCDQCQEYLEGRILSGPGRIRQTSRRNRRQCRTRSAQQSARAVARVK